MSTLKQHAGGKLVDARGRKYLTTDERTRFLAAVSRHPKPATKTLACTLAMTGCRVSEALGLRACDVDLHTAEIRIATLKRRREHWRSVPIPEDLAQALDLVTATALKMHQLTDNTAVYLLSPIRLLVSLRIA